MPEASLGGNTADLCELNCISDSSPPILSLDNLMHKKIQNSHAKVMIFNVQKNPGKVFPPFTQFFFFFCQEGVFVFFINMFSSKKKGGGKAQ